MVALHNPAQAVRKYLAVALGVGDDATADIRGVPGTSMLRVIVPVESESGVAATNAIQFVWRT